jgi:hypothetical protein
MNRVANELVKVAKEIMAAPVMDLAEVKAVLDETRKKQDEYDRRQEETRRELNLLWTEANDELDNRIKQLLDGIRDALVEHFIKIGYGVRYSAADGSLVEVFLGGGKYPGSKETVDRYQSKVGVMIKLTFKGREKATYMLRNENVDETIEKTLSDRNTIPKLLAEVKRAEQKGFWG